MMLAMLLLAAGVHTDFEAGNLAASAWISETHLRVTVRGEVDQNRRNRQPSWFYFRIDGASGRALTIDITGLAGEYNFRLNDGSGLRNMRPVYSYDTRNWNHFEHVTWLAAESTIRVRLQPKAEHVWIARIAPYTTRHLEKLRADLRHSRYWEETVIGRTVKGRLMRLWTITNFAVPDARKKILWLMARQHAWEAGTSWVAEGALRFLVSDDPAATRLRDTCLFRVFPMADPDGVARGGVRFNEHGYDLNRNWDAADPVLMPEIAAQRKAVLDWVDSGKTIDLFLTLHNTEANDYVQGPLKAGGPAMRELGQRFWKLLTGQTAFYAPEGPRDSGETTTPGMKGRMTVDQGLFHDRKVPAFLMELMVDASPKLGRCPTVRDRLEFGAALVRAMAEAAGSNGKQANHPLRRGARRSSARGWPGYQG